MRITKQSVQQISESVAKELTKPDIINLVKKDKDMEKAIRSIVVDVVTDFFKMMYQHDSIFKTLVK